MNFSGKNLPGHILRIMPFYLATDFRVSCVSTWKRLSIILI